jgi:hypothetical protein
VHRRVAKGEEETFARGAFPRNSGRRGEDGGSSAGLLRGVTGDPGGVGAARGLRSMLEKGVAGLARVGAKVSAAIAAP